MQLKPRNSPAALTHQIVHTKFLPGKKPENLPEYTATEKLKRRQHCPPLLPTDSEPTQHIPMPTITSHQHFQQRVKTRTSLYRTPITPTNLSSAPSTIIHPHDDAPPSISQIADRCLSPRPPPPSFPSK